jgi:3-phosphoshikimate 1-carboxyvinyltransferase
VGSSPTFPKVDLPMMTTATTFGRGALRGRVRVPGDKSISHRALLFGAVSRGTTVISNANRGADVRATREALAAMGIRIQHWAGRDNGATLVVSGGTLRDPVQVIDCLNSGSTARMLMGLIAGAGVRAQFTGDESLQRRPMERVAVPLRTIGATIETTNGRLPATIVGVRNPAGGTFALSVPSAQVKSAILLAHLNATGTVKITGDNFSRDHTERMLQRFGAEVAWDGETVVFEPRPLIGTEIEVPGDISAAAFFFVAASIVPGSDLVVERIGVNPTRTGIIDALRAMGASITYENYIEVGGEPIADVRVVAAPLIGTTISGALVSRMIDELPVFGVAAAFATTPSVVSGAEELRQKESDRIATLAALLRAVGADIEERPDGFAVTPADLHEATAPVSSAGDHRIAMSAAVLAAGTGNIHVDDAAPIAISFPDFQEIWTTAQS